MPISVITACRHVTSACIGCEPGRLGRDLGTVSGPEGVERPVPVDAAVGVGAEVVAQALDQRGGQAGAAQPVVVGPRRGERRAGHAAPGPPRPPPPPPLPTPPPPPRPT